jgi:CRISPR-associated protein Cas2
VSEAPRRWLIAYDVTDDARRGRIARQLSTYGDRIQYSVFLVDARPAKLVRLRAALAALIDPSDSVLIAEIGQVGEVADHRFLYLGRQRSVTGSGHLIV